MFRAAFTSRSCVSPHAAHIPCLTTSCPTSLGPVKAPAVSAHSRRVPFADDWCASAGLRAFVLQLRFEHSPPRIEHGWGPCRADQGCSGRLRGCSDTVRTSLLRISEETIVMSLVSVVNTHFRITLRIYPGLGQPPAWLGGKERGMRTSHQHRRSCSTTLRKSLVGLNVRVSSVVRPK